MKFLLLSIFGNVFLILCFSHVTYVVNIKI
jgi:hypothetical protein